MMMTVDCMQNTLKFEKEKVKGEKNEVQEKN